MKNKTAIFILLLSLVAALYPADVLAQTSPYVFDTTIPVDTVVRADVDAWLGTYNPSSAVYYAITYARADGMDWIVCLASFDLASPEEKWSLTENAQGVSKLIWLGTVRVYSDHSVELLTDPQILASSNKLASPIMPAPGGGPSIRFPFQLGKSAMYGPRGVHNAGYSTYGTGMKAIDLVSGSDMGSGAASDQVFASALGEIDYVCEDGTSVTVRVNDETAQNKFIYAHLVDNASLEVSTAFTKGQLIATLVHGTFDDDCGYADQQDNHYHLHWGFEPASNAYTVEGCVINTNTSTIKCGDNVINTGGFLTATGGVGGYDDGRSNSPTFWDYLLVAYVTIFDRGIIKLLPEHTSPTLLPSVMLNMVRFVLRLAYALLVTNFNLGPAIIALLLALAFRVLMGGIYLVFAVLRTAKAVPGL